MSHDLSIKADGSAEMFSGENITPWHGLGTVVEGLKTATEAIKLAKLDWRVRLRPVYVDDKAPRLVDDYQAVEREDNNKVLSIVGNRYVPIANDKAFEFFDEIVRDQTFFQNHVNFLVGKIKQRLRDFIV